VHVLDRSGCAIGATLPDEDLGLDERPDALLEEEWIAFRALEQEPSDGVKTDIRAQECVEQLAGGLRGERIEPELRVVGLGPPAVLVLAAVVDQEQDARGEARSRMMRKKIVGAGCGCEEPLSCSTSQPISSQSVPFGESRCSETPRKNCWALKDSTRGPADYETRSLSHTRTSACSKYTTTRTLA